MKKILLFAGLIIAALVIPACTTAPQGGENFSARASSDADAAVEPAEDVLPEPEPEPEPEAAVEEAVPEPVEELAEEPEPIPFFAEEIIEPEIIAEEEIAEPEPEPEPEPEVIAEAEPEPIPEPVAEPELIAEPEPVAEPEPPAPVVAEAPPPPPPPPPPPVIPPVPVQPPPPQEEPVPPPAPAQPLPPSLEDLSLLAREPVPQLSSPNPGVRGRQDEAVNFSRVVRATVGQMIEIPFRGSGWVYLGEVASRRGVAYDSRRLDLEGQSFIFKAELAGIYTLRFSRQDFIRDFILNDYVQVVVGDAVETAGTGWFSPSIDRGRVIAEPRWPSSLEEAQAIRGNIPPAAEAAPGSASPEPAAPGTDAALPEAELPASSGAAAAPSADRPPESAAGTASPPVVSSTAPITPPTTPPVILAPPAAAAPALPAAPANENAAPAASVAPVRPEVPPSIEEYLKKAREEFDASRVASAISLLDQLYDYYLPSESATLPAAFDELYWLYGQFYEANSPSRNIRLALDYYRRLLAEYPQSVYANDAQRRISYLERYFINNR